MPEVGERGWVVLTRDTRIRFHPNEQRALLASNLRLFSVQTKRGPGGRRGVTGEEMANLIIGHIKAIARIIAKHRGPFIAGITRSDVKIMYGPDRLEPGPGPPAG